MKKLVSIVVFLLGLAMASTTAQANVTYNFYCISSNDPTGQAGEVGESAFYVDVSDPGTVGPLGEAQVLFTFGVLTGFPYVIDPEPPDYNPYGYYIDGVYFYDVYGDLLKVDEPPPSPLLYDYSYNDLLYPDVDFEKPATPEELNNFKPGSYGVSLRYSADANPPPKDWAINPGETLGVLFDLQLGSTYSQVITALNSREAIIGIKAQGFGEYSETFITIPAPGAILLGSIGVGLVGWLRRRRTL